MNNLETRILCHGEKVDINLQNVSRQIEELKELLDVLVENKEFISENDEEDEDDDFDEGAWIKL